MDMRTAAAALVAGAWALAAAGAVPQGAGDVAVRAAAEAAARAAAPATNRPTRAEIERRPEVLRKTGGFVEVAPAGVSAVAVDLRARPGGAPARFAETFSRLSRTDARAARAEARPSALAAALAARDRAGAAFALAVFDGGDAPGLAVYPEERAALVNAARYAEGPDPAAREVRVLKELWRGLGFAAGLGYAPFRNDVLRPVHSVGELDALEWQVMQPANFQRMYAEMARLGVRRARRVPYRLAVREGWAAPPTNAWQRAVWEEERSARERGPSRALRIAP